MSGDIEGGRPRRELTPQQTKPEQALAHGGRESTSVQPPVFGNCIVRDLMPSSERVDEMLAEGSIDEMLAEGSITEERAVHLKKEAYARERDPLIADRIQDIKRMLIADGLSTTEKRPLWGEYKSLRKEAKRIRKEAWEAERSISEELRRGKVNDDL